MRLPHAIEKSIDRRSAKFVERTLKSWALPVPKDRDFSRTNDDGFLVMLNRFGCVLRIQEESVAQARPAHRLILKPLLSKSDGRVRVEIFPGVFCANSPSIKNDMDPAQDVRSLFLRLCLDGYDFWDDAERNIGYIPDHTGGPDKRKPVVLDLDAVKMVAKKSAEDIVRRIAKLFLLDFASPRVPAFGAHGLKAGGLTRIFRRYSELEENANQDVFYHDLRTAFAAAAGKPKRKDVTTSMLSVWKLCADSCAQGVLVAGWQGVFTRGVSRIGRNYDERISSSRILRKALKL